jgi:hypothetical protein
MTRIELYRLTDEPGGGMDELVFVTGWTPVRVRQGRFVDGQRFGLRQVPFPDPGVYEFRLALDGYPEPLIDERVYLEP